MNDDSHLHAKVRKAIDVGDLPNHPPVRWRGGSSTGARCAVCGELTTLGQIELELEFISNGNGEWAAYSVHSYCFRIFVIELGRGRSASQRAVKFTDGNVAEPQNES